MRPSLPIYGTQSAFNSWSAPTHDPLQPRGLEEATSEVVMPDGSPGPGFEMSPAEAMKVAEELSWRCDVGPDARFVVSREDGTRVVMDAVQLFRCVGSVDGELARAVAALVLASGRFNDAFKAFESRCAKKT